MTGSSFLRPVHKKSKIFMRKEVFIMKRKIITALLVTLLLSVLSVSAFAYVSDADKASGNAAAIQACTDAYNAAAARGDTAGMAAAHDAAEAIRSGSGYSGGSDGSGSSSGSGSSGGSSGRSSSGSSGGSSGGSSSGSSSSSKSTADLLKQADANSAAWHTAPPEERTRLEQENAQIREQIAKNGADVSYDPQSGITIVKDSSTGISYFNGNDGGGSGTVKTYTSSTTSGSTTVQKDYLVADSTVYASVKGAETKAITVIEWIRESSTDSNGNVTLGEIENVMGDHVYVCPTGEVVVQSTAVESAIVALTEKYGAENVNAYNIAAYINEKYSYSAYAIAAESMGTTATWVDESGVVHIDESVFGLDNKAAFISCLADFVEGYAAERGVGAYNDLAYEEFYAIYAKIAEIEESAEIKDLQALYSKYFYMTPEEMADEGITEERRQAMLTELHDTAEAIRAEYGYSAGTDGGYYIPFAIDDKTTTSIRVGGGDDPNTPPVDPDSPDVFAVEVSYNEGGSADPGKGAHIYVAGASPTVTITPEKNYYIDDVKVDGKSVGAVTSYTFNKISANHTIDITFKKGESYTITVTTTGSGTVNPGTTSVPKGRDQNFTFVPAAGYIVKYVTVDGVRQTTANSYKFTNVTKNHTLHIDFVKAPKLDIKDVTFGTDDDPHGAKAAAKGYPTTLKAGYGFFIDKLDLQAENVAKVVITAEANLKGNKQTVTLQQVDGKWQFPVNKTSVTSARKIYVDKATPDSTYDVEFTAIGYDETGAEVIRDTFTGKIRVNGDMFQDDYTSDRH